MKPVPARKLTALGSAAALSLGVVACETDDTSDDAIEEDIQRETPPDLEEDGAENGDSTEEGG